MRRTLWIAVFGISALGLGSCAQTFQERNHDLVEDGLFLYKKGNYSAARETFQSALAMQPRESLLLYNIAQCSEKLGEYQVAERTYGDLLVRRPDHAPTRQALCALLVAQDRRDDARKLVDEWLSYEPRSASAHAADGWLSFQAGNHPEAQSKLQKALELDNKNATALMTLGQVFEKNGRPDRALNLYQRARESDANLAEVEETIARLMAQGVGKPRID